jgi:hypothetical protein
LRVDWRKSLRIQELFKPPLSPTIVAWFLRRVSPDPWSSPGENPSMWKQLCEFLRDERGCMLAMEWVFVASILTLGAVAGLLALHHAEEVGAIEMPAAVTR